MATKSVIDPNFLLLLQSLREEAEQFARSVRAGLPSSKFTTELLAATDLSAENGLHEPLAKVFELPEANRALIATYTPESPGIIGDNITLTTQLDYAAQLERAYRARYLQTFPRMVAHTVGRKDLQASSSGTFTGQVQGYVTSLLRQSAGEGNDNGGS